MLFGLILASVEFEVNLQKKPLDLEDVQVIRDCINVMGFDETKEQEVRNLDENLIKLPERACEVNLCLNSRKMVLKKPEVKFLGHITSKDALKPDPDKVRAVRKCPRQRARRKFQV